jgi:hypothetical protein
MRTCAALAVLLASAAVRADPDPLWGTTINGALDFYYDDNFDHPIGRANRLRAYDVTANNFSLNQANLVVENAADPASHKYWGARLDLQWGQATETLQGNAANEARPDIYRDVFQAYGTLAVPVRPLHGELTVDLGKFASSIGLEGNYTKDQLTYSRSLWFDALPFYHMGVRAAYRVDPHLTIDYWIVNGTEATEAVNNYKDQLIGVVVTPVPSVSWSASYYRGQEHPDTVYFPNGGAPANSPTQQGTPFQPIADPPTGLLEIIDTYATWTAASALTFAAEADYVHAETAGAATAQRLFGGALYARYAITPALAVAARGELMWDRDALYSGTSQRLDEGTLAARYAITSNTIAMLELRRDASDHPYFYASTLDILDRAQTTITLGAVWWFGGKQGAW